MVYKRKSYAKRSKSKVVVKRAKRITMAQLPRAIQPEVKGNSREVESYTLSALTENVLALANVAYISQGPGFMQRIGNSIRLKSIQVRGHCENRSAASQTTLVRMAIIEDTKTSEGFTGDNCLIKLNTPVSLGSLGAESSYLAWNKSRYKVIYDNVLKLGSNSTNGSNIKLFNVYKKLAGEADYSYATGTPVAINKGNWQFVMWACDPDNSGQSTTNVNGYVQCDLKFTDP